MMDTVVGGGEEIGHVMVLHHIYTKHTIFEQRPFVREIAQILIWPYRTLLLRQQLNRKQKNSPDAINEIFYSHHRHQKMFRRFSF